MNFKINGYEFDMNTVTQVDNNVVYFNNGTGFDTKSGLPVRKAVVDTVKPAEQNLMIGKYTLTLDNIVANVTINEGDAITLDDSDGGMFVYTKIGTTDVTISSDAQPSSRTINHVVGVQNNVNGNQYSFGVDQFIGNRNVSRGGTINDYGPVQGAVHNYGPIQGNLNTGSGNQTNTHVGNVSNNQGNINVGPGNSQSYNDFNTIAGYQYTVDNSGKLLKVNGKSADDIVVTVPRGTNIIVQNSVLCYVQIAPPLGWIQGAIMGATTIVGQIASSLNCTLNDSSRVAFKQVGDLTAVTHDNSVIQIDNSGDATIRTWDNSSAILSSSNGSMTIRTSDNSGVKVKGGDIPTLEMRASNNSTISISAKIDQIDMARASDNSTITALGAKTKVSPKSSDNATVRI